MLQRQIHLFTDGLWTNQRGRWTFRQTQSHMWTTCGETERTGRRLRPTTVFGAGSFLTFPTFPETGTVEDSRNSRNELWGGGGGGVETGREIRVSVVEWCYQRTLFLGWQEEREKSIDFALITTKKIIWRLIRAFLFLAYFLNFISSSVCSWNFLISSLYSNSSFPNSILQVLKI